MESGEGVFCGPIVARVAYVAFPVPRLVGVEVVELLRPALRHRSSVTVTRIITVVDVAVKAARAVKPWASSNEQARQRTNPAHSSRREHSYMGHSRSTHRGTQARLQC